MSFETTNQIWLKKEIWEHYDITISETSYNFVNEGAYENICEANKFHFKIHNSDDSFKAASLEYIWFDLNFIDEIHFNLAFTCPWEDEHGITINLNPILESEFRRSSSSI